MEGGGAEHGAGQGWKQHTRIAHRAGRCAATWQLLGQKRSSISRCLEVRVSLPHRLVQESVPPRLHLSGMIYGEQQVLWKGKSAGSCFAWQIRTPPSLINSHFPSPENPGGAISFYLKQRQASYLIYRLQGWVAPWLVAKVSFKWKSGWRDITYILPAIC